VVIAQALGDVRNVAVAVRWWWRADPHPVARRPWWAPCGPPVYLRRLLRHGDVVAARGRGL